MSVDERALVQRSVERYRRAHRRYERRHPEIFNDVEQARLRGSLAAALDDARRADRAPRVLDLGCGSGNLTAHLVDLGAEVVAADVSPEFLATVERRFAGQPVTTFALSGVDLAGVPDASLDMVAAYSVLHHIPDYLAMLDELVRVVRPGGLVYLDHEVNEHFWGPDGCGHRFREELRRHRAAQGGLWNPECHPWQQRLRKDWWLMRFWPERFFGREGDIHVWPEDHIEWDLIVARLERLGCTIARRDDYLQFEAGWPRELWEAWRAGGCTDMACLVARRRL